MAKIFTLLLFCLLQLPCFAQDYFFKQYRVENGLPTDVIKSCTQDSLGYYWIATDDGLVKYDGIKFTTYHEAMHNDYVKGFYTTRSGRLLAWGDLDLIEIKNLGDTIIFKSICPVALHIQDSALSYPKFIYEDVHGSIWVSESQSVTRLNGKSFKRYNFDIAVRSPQYLRSFSIFEDRKHNLFVASFQGNVFKYNPQSDRFEIEPEKFPHEVEYAGVTPGNRILIGAAEGLYESELLEEGGFSKPKLLFNTPFVSYVAKLRDQRYFIATRGSKHFIADMQNNTFMPLPRTINNINHVYVSRERNFWLSGNDGLIVFKENLMQQVSNDVSQFIEAIDEDVSTGKIYYANTTTLYSYDKATRQNKIEFTVPGGYFQSVLMSNDGLWIANAFKVFLRKDNRTIKEFDFSKDARFITDIGKDVYGNIWLAEQGNPDMYMIDRSLQLKRIKIPLGKEGVINMVYTNNEGVYVASTGKESYLFYKANSDSIFKNISVPINIETQNNFNVVDMTIMNNTIWLATSEGLLKYDHHTVQRVDFGTVFSKMPVKAVKSYTNNQLLFANAYGMILYNPATGDYEVFNEVTGMLSNTIVSRGIFIGKDQTVWIGTSKGLCYSRRPLIELRPTPMPQFVETLVNGKYVRIRLKKEIDYGSFITVKVSSITFPEKEINIQYRLSPQEEWSTVHDAEINLSSLPAGTYTLEVRSKKIGLHMWSDIAQLRFTIAKPFWQQFWFFVYCFVIVLLLVATAITGANLRNKKRNEELQKLIDERTNTLRVTNEELAHRNTELDRFVYSASHDLSAPLKSILGLIVISKMETNSPSMNNYLDMMKQSVLKLDSFIKDIISYSRNSRMEIKKEPVNFNALIQSIWTDLSFTPDADKIKFEIINELRSELKSDETRLRIIFNNLLSNAIKFHQRGEVPFINVYACESETHFEFAVQDNGIGISDEYKEKIFDMFFRANEKAQGSGLGLYILKEALAKLNGTIKVESTLGEGATFIIHLPK